MATSNSIKQLGILIKSSREAAGYSTRALGSKAGVNDSTIVRLEQGLRNNPSPEVLTKLAQALHLKLANVFSLAGYAVPQELPTPPTACAGRTGHLYAPPLQPLWA